MYSFSYLEPVCCSMSSSNCCFLTCIQVSQEASQVIWYSHLFQNFPQFIVIHMVEGFGVVNKAEIGVFLEPSCFFNDPADIGNLISDLKFPAVTFCAFLIPQFCLYRDVNYDYSQVILHFRHTQPPAPELPWLPCFMWWTRGIKFGNYPSRRKCQASLHGNHFLDNKFKTSSFKTSMFYATVNSNTTYTNSNSHLYEPAQPYVWELHEM